MVPFGQVRGHAEQRHREQLDVEERSLLLVPQRARALATNAQPATAATTSSASASGTSLR